MTKPEIPMWCANHTGNMTMYLMHYYCSKIEVDLATCTIVQSESDMESIRILCETSEIVWYVLFWFSIVVGTIGNALALWTIASLPISIATFFVGLLAFSDFIGIVMRTIIYFLNKERLLNPTTPYWHIFPLLFDFSVSYSNWLLVLICLDRFITVRYPLQRRFYFTLCHAKIAAFTMAVILFVIYFVAAQTLGYKDVKMFTVRNLLYSVIPLILILILIFLIAVQFRIIHKKRKLLQAGSATNQSASSSNRSSYRSSHLTSGLSPHRSEKMSSISTQNSPSSLRENSNGSCPQNNRPRRPNVFEDIERLENNITIMMMVTAICFAILTIPNCVLLFTFSYAAENWNTPLARARWHVFSKTSQVLTFLNLSINFLLYFLTANKFRHQLCKLLRIRRDSQAAKSVPSHQTTCLLNTQTPSETYL